MRLRITVRQGGSEPQHDVGVECHPDDPVGAVVTGVQQALGVTGIATVEGVPLDPQVPVSRSALRDGALVSFSASAAAGGRWGDDDRWAGVGRWRAEHAEHAELGNGGGAGTAGGQDDRGWPTGGRRPGNGGKPGGDLQLLVRSGPSAGSQLRLPGSRQYVVGRTRSADLVLDDPDVSARHLRVRALGDSVELTDLGSTNGTLLRGEPVTGPTPAWPGDEVQLGASRLAVERSGARRAEVVPDGAGGLLVNRLPGSPPPWTPPTIQFPPPPLDDEDIGRPFPGAAIGLPVLLSVAMAAMLHRPQYLLIGLFTPVMAGWNWLSERRDARRRAQRRAGRAARQMAATQVQARRAADDEDANLRAGWPEPGTVLRTAMAPLVGLWRRRPSDDDWLRLRLGVADRPSSTAFTGEAPEGWTAPVLRAAPTGVRLDQRGALGLAGPDREVARSLGWVTIQLATLHSPENLQLAVVAPGQRPLAWLRWLPHLRAPDGTVRAAWDEAAVAPVVAGLEAVLDERAEAAHRAGGAVPAGRQLVVLLAGAARLRRRPDVARLLRDGPRVGMYFVCTESDPRLLPGECTAKLALGPGVASLEVDREAAVLLAPDQPDEADLEPAARALAPLRVAGDRAGGGMPPMVRLAELIGGRPDTNQVVAGWRLSPDRTEVAIGAGGGGPVRLDIAAHGPHALLAGTTGAGKSELLQTWMAALALASTPRDLNFIFVDYKGGPTFKDLNPLPHVVGTVTNLDARLAARALSSLEAELRRRQEQLAAAHARDLAEYRRLARTDPALGPFPRLVIVVDEFAEMKEELPDLVDGLVRVARLGRSLGVHLVLATQRPSGVISPQIRANTELRICLRVADAGESMDVVDIPDAASLGRDAPGRAYLRRGSEAPVLVQTAYVGGSVGTADEPVRRVVPLAWSDTGMPPAGPAAPDVPAPTDLQALVGAVSAAAAAEGLAAPYRPWQDELPEVVLLESLPAGRHQLVLGLRDLPEQQRQEPLLLPLGSGQLAIVGSPRTGRTSTLRAVAVGLARGAAPGELHLHGIDGSGGLAGLASLPHTGVVVRADDGERLDRLLARLESLVRDRQRLLAERGAAGVDELWQRDPGHAPPHVVLLVDGAEAVLDERRSDAFVRLLSSGLAAGVTVCLAGDESVLRSRLASKFAHRLFLRLNNPADATFTGLPAAASVAGLPSGRGRWAADGSEVQVPLLAADRDGQAQAAALATVATRLQARYGAAADPAAAPMRLDPLPEAVSFDTAVQWGKPPEPGRFALLAVGGDRLAARWVDVGDHRCVLVAGPPRSGRSTAAACVAASLALGGGRVLLVAAQPNQAHARAAARGVRVIRAEDLTAALDPGAAAVVIDDADQQALPDAVLPRLGASDGPALVVAAHLDSFAAPRGVLKPARRAARAVVLLSPPGHLDAANVGIRIERGSGFTGPPGRAYLAIDGQLELAQVPELS